MENEWVSKEAKFQERDLRLAEAFHEAHEDNFDPNFINSLRATFETKGYLTDNQYKALSNTVDKWRMEDWADGEGFNFDVKP